MVKRTKKMKTLESYFKVSLKEEIKRSSKLKIEDIAEIKRWMSSQPHLPHSPDILIAHFLKASDYDMDVAKKAIKLNFECKRSTPEFFDEWDPLSDALQEQAKHVTYIYTKVNTSERVVVNVKFPLVCHTEIRVHYCSFSGVHRGVTVAYTAFLPKTSSSHPRLCFSRVKEGSASLYDYALGVKWYLMSIQSILFHEGQQEFTLIVDAAPFTFSHALKHPYRLVRKCETYFSHAAPMRMTGVHFLNSNFVVRKMVGLLKMFISEKLLKMIHFHGAPEEFFDSIPSDSVPKDYGGTGPSLETLDEENTRRVLETRNALIAFCNFK